MNAVENIHNIEFLANQMFVLEKLKQWQKLKPDNIDLKDVINKYLEITFYVIRLEQDAMAKNMLIIWCGTAAAAAVKLPVNFGY